MTWRASFARMSLSMAKVVWKEHQTPFTHNLRPALCVFCRTHNALRIAPAGVSHNEALVTILERAAKLLRITLAPSTVTGCTLQLSDARWSREGRHNEYTRGELVVLLDWLVVFVGRNRQKARKHTPEARRVRASKLAHKRGGITKAVGALRSLLQ